MKIQLRDNLSQNQFLARGSCNMLENFFGCKLFIVSCCGEILRQINSFFSQRVVQTFVLHCLSLKWFKYICHV